MNINTSPFKYRKEDGTFSDVMALQGKDGTINGKNKIDIVAGNGIDITTTEEEVVISTNSKIAKNFSTIEDLKNDTNLKIGDVVQTLGYYEINDGGGAIYKIGILDSNSYQEEISAGLYATLIIEEVLNVLQFGVIAGDNISNLILDLLNKGYNNLNIDVPIKLSPMVINNNLTLNFMNNEISFDVLNVENYIFTVNNNIKFNLKNAIFDGKEISSPSILRSKDGSTINIVNCNINNLVERDITKQTHVIRIHNGSNAKIIGCNFNNIKQTGNSVISDGSGAGSCILSDLEYLTEPVNKTSLIISDCKFMNCYNINEEGNFIVEDFDGIRCQNGENNFNLSIDINNCIFENVSKRAIKIQTNNANINNISHINDGTILDNEDFIGIFYNNHNISNCNYKSKNSTKGMSIQTGRNININNVNIECELESNIHNCLYLNDVENLNINNINFKNFETIFTFYKNLKNIFVEKSNFKTIESIIDVTTRTVEDFNPESGIVYNNIIINNCSFECLGLNNKNLISLKKMNENVFKNIKINNCLFDNLNANYQYGVFLIEEIENINFNNNKIYFTNNTSNNLFNLVRSNVILDYNSCDTETDIYINESSLIYNFNLTPGVTLRVLSDTDVISKILNLYSKIKGTVNTTELNYKSEYFDY